MSILYDTFKNIKQTMIERTADEPRTELSLFNSVIFIT